MICIDTRTIGVMYANFKEEKHEVTKKNAPDNPEFHSFINYGLFRRCRDNTQEDGT